MEIEQTLTVREIATAYLDYNGLSISYMARVTHIPDSTLRKWLDGERDINVRNLQKVKEFLKGDFLLGCDDVVNHLLQAKEVEAENEN